MLQTAYFPEVTEFSEKLIKRYVCNLNLKDDMETAIRRSPRSSFHTAAASNAKPFSAIEIRHHYIT